MKSLKLLLPFLLLNFYSILSFSQKNITKNIISIGSNGDCGNNYFYNSNGTLLLKVTTTCDSITGKRLTSDSLYAEINLFFYEIPDSTPLLLNSAIDLNKAILTMVDSTDNIVFTKTLIGIEFPLETITLTKGEYKLKVYVAKK